MLLIHAKDISISFSDRLILKFKELFISSEDRIGIVGDNGSGKTTLLRILAGDFHEYSGFVKRYCEFSYVPQLEDFNILPHLSGGEKTLTKIFAGINKCHPLLMADEPTCNLDSCGINEVIKKFKEYNGAVLVVSHDRDFLDEICNRIIEIEDTKIRIYNGNYSFYKSEKEKEQKHRENEYEKYVSEKKRLTKAVQKKKEQESSVRKTPKRMGNSEARIHKRAYTGIVKKIANERKAIEKRLAMLPEKEKPAKKKGIKIYYESNITQISKTTLSVNGLNVSYGKRNIFLDASMIVYKGEKVALTGPNGSGKTTLMDRIMKGDENIRLSPSARIMLFSQSLDILNEEEDVLTNILNTSSMDNGLIRTTLAGIGFSRGDVFKKVCVLSGGEKVKACLAKVLCSDSEFILLDEPTNYLDIRAIEALETMIRNFPGSVLFTSHDKRLVENAAERIYEISNNKIIERKIIDTGDISKSITQMRITYLISRLSDPNLKKEEKEKLEELYNQLTVTNLHNNE